jgi:hypothetical protein
VPPHDVAVPVVTLTLLLSAAVVLVPNFPVESTIFTPYFVPPFQVLPLLLAQM